MVRHQSSVQYSVRERGSRGRLSDVYTASLVRMRVSTCRNEREKLKLELEYWEVTWHGIARHGMAWHRMARKGVDGVRIDAVPDPKRDRSRARNREMSS